MVANVRRAFLSALVCACLGAALAAGASPRAIAAEPAEFTVGALRVSGPIAFSTPTAARNGAAYLTLKNQGQAGDRLIAARSPAASRIELHTTLREGGVMRMRELPAIDVPAGGTVKLERGGMHVMLIDLREPLKAGARFPLTLVFEKAGTLEVMVAVESVRGAAGHHHH